MIGDTIRKLRNRRLPDIETLLKLADLFHVTIDELMGRKNDSSWGQREDGLTIGESVSFIGTDEEAETFSEKLSFLLDSHCMPLATLALDLDVPEGKIIAWLSGKEHDYKSFYKKLSTIFCVNQDFWGTPKALATDHKLTGNELVLIGLLADYSALGSFTDGQIKQLESFFPGLRMFAATGKTGNLLDAFERLDQDEQDIVIGKAKELLISKRPSGSVAADREFLETPSPSSGTGGGADQSAGVKPA